MSERVPGTRPAGRVRYRRRRSARVWAYSAWNFRAEIGDLMVTHDGRLLRLAESSGRRASAAGELTYREVFPPVAGARAVIEGEEVWWETPRGEK